MLRSPAAETRVGGVGRGCGVPRPPSGRRTPHPPWRDSSDARPTLPSPRSPTAQAPRTTPERNAITAGPAPRSNVPTPRHARRTHDHHRPHPTRPL